MTNEAQKDESQKETSETDHVHSNYRENRRKLRLALIGIFGISYLIINITKKK